MKLMELKVELLMILETKNFGAVDVANSWNVDGRTHHVEVCNVFLGELKDQGRARH